MNIAKDQNQQKKYVMHHLIMSQRKVSLPVYMNNKYTWRLLWNYENLTFWICLFCGFKNCFHATWLANQSSQAANHKL